jgi:outer membrane protein TolC
MVLGIWFSVAGFLDIPVHARKTLPDTNTVLKPAEPVNSGSRFKQFRQFVGSDTPLTKQHVHRQKQNVTVMPVVSSSGVTEASEKPAVQFSWGQAIQGAFTPMSPEETLHHWWTQLEDPTLNRLVTHLLQNNLTLKALAYDLQATDQQVRIRKAPLFPKVVFNPSANRAKYGTNSIGFLRGKAFTQYSFPIQVTQQLDYLGMSLNGYQVLKLQRDAQALQLQATHHALVSELVRLYIRLQSTESQLQVLVSQYQTQQAMVAVLQARTHTGVERQEEGLAEAQSMLNQYFASYQALWRQYHQYRQEMAVLLSEVPESSGFQNILPLSSCRDTLLSEDVLQAPPREESEVEPPSLCGMNAYGLARLHPPSTLPLGSPEALLSQRPDLKAAELLLTAQELTAKIAKKDLFPRLSLSADFGLYTFNPAHLWSLDSAFYNLGLALSQSLFEGGAKLATLKQQRLQWQSLFEDYRKQTLQAYKEVTTSATGVLRESQRVTALQAAYETQYAKVHSIEARYQSGVVTKVSVLHALQTLATLKQSCLKAQEAYLTQWAWTYQSLGASLTPVTTLSPNMGS